MNAHVSTIARTCYIELRRMASTNRFSLDWILSKNIDKSHITKINNVMPKIVRTDHTVLIPNIDIKWKIFSSKIAPKTDWSQLGNTDCRSRFVDNFHKSREEGLDFVNAVRYASNALPFKRRRSSYL